jgi:hypothetical protein
MKPHGNHMFLADNVYYTTDPYRPTAAQSTLPG